jgi:hypothetical protein
MFISLSKHTQLTHSNALCDALLPYFNNVEFNNPVAITLTLKKVVTTSDEGVRRQSFLDVIKTTQNIRYFLNRLNVKIYKNSFRRFGKRLKVIPIIEGDKNIHPHVHFTFDMPTHLTDDEFIQLVRACWGQTLFGYHQHNFTRIYDLNGWLGYKLKTRTKDDYARSVDWENINLN